MKAIIFSIILGTCAYNVMAQEEITNKTTATDTLPASIQAVSHEDPAMVSTAKEETLFSTTPTTSQDTVAKQVYVTAQDTTTRKATAQEETVQGSTADSASATDTNNGAPHFLTIFEKAYYKIKESKFAEFVGTNHWGAFGGIGPANVHFKRYDLYQHAVCNVRIGIVADHDMDMIKENLFVEAGIELQRKGYQRFFDEHADSLHVTYKEKTNLYYMVFPTTASYRFHFRGFEFTPMLGPYYAIALGGRFRYKRETHDGGQYIMQTKKYSMFGDKTDTERLYDTRRFDLGLRIAVGIQYFENMRSSMGYDWGFIDIIKSDFRGDKYKSKNGVFYLSHTYFFH